jgi:hypothetical protein
MPNIICTEPPNICDDPSLPRANYSSEAVDEERFFGRVNNPNPQEPPPLGTPWTSTGCVGTCTSTISQEDADLCAARQAVICFHDDNPSTNPNDPGGPPVTPTPTYFNTEQSATFTCPDGNVFTYTISAGTVAAGSLAAANASALSLAQNGATNNRICLGDLTPEGACAVADYTGTIDIQSPRAGQAGYTIDVAIINGSLPSGLTLTENDDDITITGIPDTAGTYTFVLFAQVMFGGSQVSSITKAFSIYVIEISEDTLPDGNVGNAYNQTLTAIGPTFGLVTWAVTSGALPDGLSLNTSTGAITGMPTLAGTYSFEITMTDER